MKAMTSCIFIVLIILLTSCAPAPATTPTPTSIPTITPTALPIPQPLTGTIFWDANGSGLQDETSFIVPEYDPSNLPYFFQVLEANGTDTSSLVEDEIATVQEPTILGIQVCVGNICSETDKKGVFTIIPEKKQTTYSLKLIDPNADDPKRAFRYINKWNGPMVIESYELNGVAVPGQLLYDTEILDINGILAISPHNETTVGLMQGFLTAPLYCDDWLRSDPVHGFDHDVRTGYAKDFRGITRLSTLPGRLGTGDQHSGWDYGTIMGTEVISMAPGSTSNWKSDDGGTHVRVDHRSTKDYKGNFAVTLYGHLSAILERNRLEPRGKVIGLAGKSGTTHWVHIHSGTCINSDPFICRDPFGIEYDDFESEIIGSEGEYIADSDFNNYFRMSLWTVYNIPNCLYRD